MEAPLSTPFAPAGDRPVDALEEFRVRRASVGLFVLNCGMLIQLAFYNGVWFFGRDVGDIIIIPWVLAGIGLALKLRSWDRSFFLGHSLIFLYTCGVFYSFIPYFASHWLLRLQGLFYYWRAHG